MVNTTSGLKNINLLTKEQYDTIAEPVKDELYAVSGSGIGFPSSSYEDLTLGASGSTYTAPANGWFFINRGSTSGNKYVEISNGIAAVASTTISGIANAAVLYPVRKGDVVTVKYTANTSGPAFRFIYAEGE